MSAYAQPTATSEQVAKNLVKVGGEKLTVAVLNAKRSDHLLIRGRGHLVKANDILKEVSKLTKTLTPNLAWKIVSGLNSIMDGLAEINKQRRQGETELRGKVPQMADRIYIYGVGMETRRKLVMWSEINYPHHSRLIDVNDTYNISTQVPTASSAVLTEDNITTPVPDLLLKRFD